MSELIDQDYGEFDPVRNYLEAVPRLTNQARRAAKEEGISYRDFYVGIAGQLLVANDKRVNMLDLSAANMKLSEDEEKYCAEMNIIDQTMDVRGRKQFVGLVIAGPSGPGEVEGVSELPTATLQPCKVCRGRMMSRRKLFGESTLILSIGLDEDIAQVHSWGELSLLWRRAAEASTPLTLDVGMPLDLAEWEQNVELYDELLAQNRNGVSRSLIAELAIENGLQEAETS